VLNSDISTDTTINSEDDMSGFDETFDYVVVGSGGGSLCAALVMGRAGKSCLILEKTPFVGGTTARSGGAMWIPNNRYMKRDGIPDSTEKAMTYLDGIVGDDPSTPGASRERRRKYVSEAPKMIDFIAANGVRLTRTEFWPDYYDNRPGGSRDSRSVFSEVFDGKELGDWLPKLRVGFIPQPVNLADIFPLPLAIKQALGTKVTVMVGAMHLGEMMKLQHFKKSLAGWLMIGKVGCRWLYGKLTGKYYMAAGAGLQGQMLKAALSVGTDIRTHAAVTELIEENGRVTGVVTEKDGKPWRIGARLGVLINAGGFAHNQAMRDQYAPGTNTEWTSAAEGDTGEMLIEMMNHGAAVAQMAERVGNQTGARLRAHEHQARHADGDRQAPRHSGGSDRRALPDRGRLLLRLLQGHGGAPQDRAHRARLGDFRRAAAEELHVRRRYARHRPGESRRLGGHRLHEARRQH
jgi:3-oxosteroid 1-dehydrogenase